MEGHDKSNMPSPLTDQLAYHFADLDTAYNNCLPIRAERKS